MLRRNRQTVLLVVLSVLFAAMRHCVWSVFAGAGKAILVLAVASLLMFLVVRSSDVTRLLTKSLKTLCWKRFLFSVDIRHTSLPRRLLVPEKPPTLPFLFQIPPPLFQ